MQELTWAHISTYSYDKILGTTFHDPHGVFTRRIGRSLVMDLLKGKMWKEWGIELEPENMEICFNMMGSTFG